MRRLAIFTAFLFTAACITSLTYAAPSQPRRYPTSQRKLNRNVSSRTWKTHHGPRVTVGARFHGHGHAAPIRRSATPHRLPVKTPAAKRRIATTRHHRHHSFSHAYIGRRHPVAVGGARIVVPAVTTSVLVHQPSEEVVLETPALPDDLSQQPWQVQGVLDGTRLVVRREGHIQQVRLLGVALPAEEAKACGTHLETLADGRDVYLAFDEAIAPQDAEGITTAYVYLADNGTMLNLAMIQQGYGLAEGGYEHSFTDLFVAAQAEARENALGFWKQIATPVE